MLKSQEDGMEGESIMKCPVCKKKLPDGVNFCSGCGSKISLISEEKTEKRGDIFRAVLIVLLVLLLLAVGGILVWAFFSGKFSYGSEPSVSVVRRDSDKAETERIEWEEDSEDFPVTEESETIDSEGFDLSETEEEASEVFGMESGTDEEESESEVVSEEDPVQDPVEELILISDSYHFTVADLEEFDADMCRFLRNGIYARHGRKFDDDILTAYFGNFDWYSGTIDPDDFDDRVLNDCEIDNLDFIVAYEKEMGYRD